MVWGISWVRIDLCFLGWSMGDGRWIRLDGGFVKYMVVLGSVIYVNCKSAKNGLVMPFFWHST